MVKAWEIEGYAFDGSALCVPCAVKARKRLNSACTCESRDANGLCDSNCSGNGPNPIFASDEGGDTETSCDTCGATVQEALESDDDASDDASADDEATAEVCDYCENSQPCAKHATEAQTYRCTALAPSNPDCDTHARDDFDDGSNAFGMTKADRTKLAEFQGYRLTLSENERDAFDFAEGRYGWGDWARVLAFECESVPAMRDWNTSGPITFLVPEYKAWGLKESAESDDAPFPCAAPALAHKLQHFVDSIV